MGAKKDTWVLALPIAAIGILNLALFALLFVEDSIDYETPLSDLLWPLLAFVLLALLASAILVLVIHNKQALCNPVRERQGLLIIKLGLIPAYLYGGFLAIFMAFVPDAVVGSVIFVAIGYVVMLLGSVWGICYALSLARAGAISSGIAALFIVMEFFFVLDVVAAIIMFVMGRSYEKQSWTRA